MLSLHKFILISGQSKIEKPLNSNYGESTCKKIKPLHNNFVSKIELPATDTQSRSRKTRAEIRKQYLSKDIIMFEYCNDSPQNILSRISSNCNVDLKWENFKGEGVCKSSVLIDNVTIATITAATKRAARNSVSL